jgi:hypothetical protein
LPSSAAKSGDASAKPLARRSRDFFTKMTIFYIDRGKMVYFDQVGIVGDKSTRRPLTRLGMIRLSIFLVL